MRSYPHKCPKCEEEGSYYGILAFVKVGDPLPTIMCPIHKTVALVPVH
jgi:hypothetical protein